MKKFSTKARTLEMLQHQLKHAEILPLVIFTFADWNSNKINIAKKITHLLGAGPWIVRSSFSEEDKLEASNAGAFASVLNVESGNLEEAINVVYASYNNNNQAEEIFVQPMLNNAKFVGVAFSHDPNTGSPDRIINWSNGPDTQAVTSGLAGNVWQIAAGATIDIKWKALEPIAEVIEELLSIFEGVPIDCEFAITGERNDLILWVLQVRPLTLSASPKSSEKHLEQLTRIKEKTKIGMERKPFITGKRTVYGIMPDWNPAEIIGIRPKPLAMSLYQELITDSIWAYQRHNYGYRNLRSFPLMLDFSGIPYIDVRVSFNSFIPSNLDDKIAGKLVDYYIDKLVSQPALHDKVEFEIVFSCYTFDLQSSLHNLKNFGFSKDDQNCISDSLRNLTNAVLHPKNGLWRKDAVKLDTLYTRFQNLKSSNLTPIEKIYWLVEDCKRYGTLPFAGLARAAFMGVQILRSLVHLNIFSEENYRDLMESISTVSSKMVFDQKVMEKNSFLEKYGHLRPGTYDILSPRYDAKPDLYFNWDKLNKKISPPEKLFVETNAQKKEISKLLVSNGIQTDADNLLDFIRSTIELREKAKFEFTRNLSEALSLIEKVGAQSDLTADDLSYCSVNDFQRLYLSAEKPKEVLKKSIAIGKSKYKETLGLSLPPLITRPDDIMSFEWPHADPNYITQKKVLAPITNIPEKNEIADKIILIPNADPGYDWIFSYPISGFITAWGGVNSHMAIRAGEQEVPAVIGAGEILFRKWSSCKYLMLDCANKRVEIIQ